LLTIFQEKSHGLQDASISTTILSTQPHNLRTLHADPHPRILSRLGAAGMGVDEDVELGLEAEHETGIGQSEAVEASNLLGHSEVLASQRLAVSLKTLYGASN